MMKPQLCSLSLACLFVGAAVSGQGKPAGSVAHVDSGIVPYTLVERNLVVACVMS